MINTRTSIRPVTRYGNRILFITNAIEKYVVPVQNNPTIHFNFHLAKSLGFLPK